MSDRIFLDTNVLIYASLKKRTRPVETSPHERLAASATDMCISTQVVNEYYRILLKNGFSDNDIQQRIITLIESSELVLIFESTIRLSWLVRKKYQFSFWDSLIIASAVESECNFLYSEDFQHNQIVENNLRVVNPFL